MQVKKFEARTMKEALEMVKLNLGPDAIILSARDNQKKFGLMGQGSVEITAAVSEETLRKKKFAESRMLEQQKEKLMQSSARNQRQVFDKFVNNYHAQNEAPKPITKTRYIEIDEEVDGIRVVPDGADERIKSAAQRAWNAMQAGTWVEPTPQAVPQKPSSVAKSQAPQQRASDHAEIQALKGEIETLRRVLSDFKKVPQNVLGQHPGADYGLSYEVSQIYEKLVQAGIAEQMAADILLQAQEKMPAAKLKNKALVDAWVAKNILDSTLVAGEKLNSKVQLFVGPSGAGKTSSLVKLASHYVVKEKKKVALISADVFKVGAADQMRIYAQILNIPFALIRQKSDWEKISAAMSSYDYILVDFPGWSMKSMEEISALRGLMPPETMPFQTHLVLSCMAKDSDLHEIGKRYRVAEFTDVIFTGLDESQQHGNIYNFMMRFQRPLHSFGIGSRVPEDFEMASKERLLDLIFKLTKIKKD
jgi:flagellar biosynthesis protein FlhF